MTNLAEIGTNGSGAGQLDAQIRQTRASEIAGREAMHREYAAILHRHSSALPGDGARLLELAGIIGANVDEDLAIIERESVMAMGVVELEQDQAQLKESEERLKLFQREIFEAMEKYRAVELPMVQAVSQLRSRVADKARRAVEIKKFRADNWRLFGIEDPNVASTKRHLIQAIGGRSSEMTYQVLELECLMLMPGEFPHSSFDESKYEIVAAPGQTADDVAALVKQCQTLRGDHRGGRYLYRSLADYPAGNNRRDAVIFLDDPRTYSGVWTAANFPHLIPGPGQQDFSELEAELMKKLQREWRR